MKKFIPWYGKIFAKIILSRLPLPYGLWERLGLFKLGKMDDPAYALKIFFQHLNRSMPNADLNDKVFLEMGPGDSVGSALIAASIGVKKIYLVDAGEFATHDLAFYRRMAVTLVEKGYTPPDIADIKTFEELLNKCNAVYLTRGLESWKDIPDNSVDYIWSHSTLEHVRKYEFENTMRESARVLKSGGAVSHSIDLQDHLGGRLNNLRFSEKTWESDFMVNSGFYTNRLRASEIEKTFKEVGFIMEDMGHGSWEKPPTPRAKMAAPFQDMTEQDLLTRTMSVRMTKPAAAQGKIKAA